MDCEILLVKVTQQPHTGSGTDDADNIEDSAVSKSSRVAGPGGAAAPPARISDSERNEMRKMSQLTNVRVEHEKSGLLDEDKIEDDDSNIHTQASNPRFTAEIEDIVVVHNVQKTYLLGIEGVAALRYA